MRQWLGLMSGTSLDGLDIVSVSFDLNNENEKFKIHHSETIPYHAELKMELENAINISTESLLQLDKRFAQVMGQMVNNFISKHNILKESIVGIAVMDKPFSSTGKRIYAPNWLRTNTFNDNRTASGQRF